LAEPEKWISKCDILQRGKILNIAFNKNDFLKNLSPLLFVLNQLQTLKA
jgi:hypothetical protein